MNYRARLRLALLLGLCLVPGWGQTARRWRNPGLPAEGRFVVYYGTQDALALADYDVVVLDADIDAAIVRRLQARSLTLGYLSLCEVHMGRSWAAELGRQGLLLAHSERWAQARLIDLREPRWKAKVLDELIPAMLARGFAGLFLDTLDDAAYLEALDPSRFGGMSDAAVDLVRAIRSRFTQVPIMVNRGYGLLPKVVTEIDMVLGESVHSTYDAGLHAYVRVEPQSVRWQSQQLSQARRLNPDLMLFSLDYWSPGDPQGVARIYEQAQSSGFIPYVATIDLTQIVARP